MVRETPLAQWTELLQEQDRKQTSRIGHDAACTKARADRGGVTPERSEVTRSESAPERLTLVQLLPPLADQVSDAAFLLRPRIQ